MKEIIKEEEIKNIICKIFDSINVKTDIYIPVVNGLVESSLRGVDSHGIRLVPHYVNGVLSGRINSNPRIKIKKTSLTTMVLDADNTFGITAGAKAMENAIKMAKENGTGVVVVKNSSHFGAAAIYGLMAARENMVSYSFTNVDSLVVPYGGKEPFLGTNAFCFTAPMEGESPFCLDMATTVMSLNKLMMFKRQNKKLESGLAVDKNGNETTDPKLAERLIHFGNYKGYGIALMIEMMTSLMSGMPYGPNIPHMFPLDSQRRRLSHFFMAIDIKRFQPIKIYKKRMKCIADELRSIIPASGFSKVMIAGDREKSFYKNRIKNGIPLTKEIIKDYNKLLKKLNINFSL
ncbi:MAG: Ldh family oxidoreductase [Candidatus Shapirobacteria bacterium]|nr:Ldh family oxidoreductase [Candidatus Shapirobacteria bacterium]